MRIALGGVPVLVAGLVVGVRHGATQPDQADTDPLNHDSVAKQRQLNEKGRADAKPVGEVFRTARVQISQWATAK